MKKASLLTRRVRIINDGLAPNLQFWVVSKGIV